MSCSYIVGWTRLDLILGSLAHDDLLLRGAGAPRGSSSAFPTHVGNRRVGFDTRSFFPWLGWSPVFYPYVHYPFPSKRGAYWKGMISARLLCKGS